ncbi:MAG TPA: DNA ligase D [Candidatus Acidoferrum sp.]|nr:DNA ligase D [Candidatus Acidoferrum sp.]
MAKLEEYRRKRKFDRTPEPSGDEPQAKVKDKPARKRILGGAQTSGEEDARWKASVRAKPASREHGDTFVVQKHSATRLHYDFRLAVDGTLKSWAVPKGPSLNPEDKRLAVQTEDHPLDYAGFEGKIPEGNYGAGTVMVWDRGTFSPIGDADALTQIERGEIKFHLNGEKLRGSFVLVKLKHGEKKNEWLMIKHKDADVDQAWDVDAHDGSALTGRTIEEIADEVPPSRDPSVLSAQELEGARKMDMPAKVGLMLATAVDRPFSDPNWLFEIKWDGVRTLARIENGKIKLISRNGMDVTRQYPELAELPKAFSAREAVLDGEIVALDEKGHSGFARLQQRMHVRAPAPTLVAQVPATYYLFDLLYCDGYDLRHVPLLQRKDFLRRLLHPAERVRFSDHQMEQGKELYELAGANGLEGIIGKRADSLYGEGRSNSWVKIKQTTAIDAVVGGWTEPRTPGLRFGALLLGLYEGEKLRFIGHVGTGFDGLTQETIGKMLKERETAACWFDKVPEANEPEHWVKPELVARVKYSEWTPDKRLRHPVFLGLRNDAQPFELTWKTEVESAPKPEAPPPATNPNIVRAPEVVGKVLTARAQIESELFKGKAESAVVEIDGKRMRWSNLNKVYWPESGYTKRELLAYYYRMADYILPFLRDRPLVLRRYPDGIKGQSFFQKDVRDGIPDWLETVAIESDAKDGEIHYVVANDLASLLFLTSLGCIDHNPWSSRVVDLEHPDYFFFDLDPSDETDFSVVLTIARALNKKLEEIGVTPFLKTSGATGFHLYVPVEPVYAYAQLRTFAEVVARMISVEHPNLVTHERMVAKRPKGRVLIDVHQNATGKPLAAPYVVRAFPQAPVSAPVSPRELKANLSAEKFNIKSMIARVEEKGDLWADFWDKRLKLEDVMERLSASVESGKAKK